MANVDSKLVSQFSTCGVYTLLLFVSHEVTVTAGKLGKQKFPRGYYTYTGSALGKGASLKNRISRHLKKEKKMFWHIDYLLANKSVSVRLIVVAETKKKIECKVNCYLKDTSGAKILVKGFGASDCKNNCESHLLYFPDNAEPKKLIREHVKNLQELQGVLSVIVIK
ncbi:MAG: GIY-YIG nuclease family protein [archaeon]|nr:GIY-YIG nuclease family protein [Candidatus Bathyarchaeum sp.]